MFRCVRLFPLRVDIFKSYFSNLKQFLNKIPEGWRISHLGKYLVLKYIKLYQPSEDWSSGEWEAKLEFEVQC